MGYLDRLFASTPRGTDDSAPSETSVIWATALADSSDGYVLVQIGEPIEDTVSREVMEEVGLEVENLCFVGSQPWSFSDSLLVGFWCEVKGSRKIAVDHVELKEAAWFSPDEMPDRSHDHVSLTGWMMERFKALGSAVLDA